MTSKDENELKPPLFQRIKAKNLLSFGPDGIDLELGPLNVLIGPNGSGKSNLIELFGLLQAAPTNLSEPVRSGGGVSEWIWKGDVRTRAELEIEVSTESTLAAFWNVDGSPIKHTISFGGGVLGQFSLNDEAIWVEHKSTGDRQFSYQHLGGKAILHSKDPVNPLQLDMVDVQMDESILSQRKDPVQYPELFYLGFAYRQISTYRNWQFGLDNEIRRAQRTDVFPRPVSQDYRNLCVFLGKLRQDPETKSKLIDRLKDAYDELTDFELNYEGGTVQLYFHEGDRVISGHRLSDGSLRYLCLLAILLDPNPPAFIAIEEPEMGLHPDLMPRIVDLLLDASTRTQLVVTTHNDTIVDALNHRPESIVVCEKHNGQSEFKRLDRAELVHWMEDYRLGELWIKGALGGTRW